MDVTMNVLTWKSMGVCSHSVAAAQDNNDLVTFIKWMKKLKDPQI